LRNKTHSNGQVIATSQLGDLTNRSEGSTHDNGLVAELLVVVEDGLDGCHSWVLLLCVLLLGAGLVPVKNTADEGRDEESIGLSGADGLWEREHEGQVAVDIVILLEDTGGLDTLPGGSDLDQNTVLGDTDGLVELLREFGQLRLLSLTKKAEKEKRRRREKRQGSY